MAGVDFLRRRREPIAGWCLLVIGGTAFLGAIGLSQQWRHEREDLLLADRSHAEKLELARKAAARPTRPSPDSVRLQHALPQLQQPWLPVFRFIEGATQPPIFLLALSVSPDTGLVKLEGEASSFDDVLGYMRSLGGNGPLTAVQLRAHDTVVDPLGPTTVRFSINATWIHR